MTSKAKAASNLDSHQASGVSGLNLQQRLNLVMRAVTYVKRTAVPLAGTGVYRDHVVGEVRDHLLANGVNFSTSQVAPGRHLETTRKSNSGSPMVSYVAMYATTFTNVDVPTETHIVQHEAQGDDFGDKACGKASTYAEKLNLLKGLGLETGIADEGRSGSEGVDPQAAAAEPIKTPQAKAAPAPTAAQQAAREKAAGDGIATPAAPADTAPVDNTPASKGLITMITKEATNKGLLDIVTKNLLQKGTAWETMTKTQATTIRAWIDAQVSRAAA